MVIALLIYGNFCQGAEKMVIYISGTVCYRTIVVFKMLLSVRTHMKTRAYIYTDSVIQTSDTSVQDVTKRGRS